MKKLMILAAITMAAFPVSVNAASATSKSGYEYDKSLLSDPSALNWNIEACSHSGITPESRMKLAKLMGVPEANVRFEFCRRVLTAYARGNIPYEDYVQFSDNHVLVPSIARALKIGGPRPPGAQDREQADIVLPVSAKMDSGETFKGFTRASHGHGRFSVASSRHAAKCSGTYDLRGRRPMVTLPVKCSDGRSGKLEVTRTADLMSAWGTVKLSDGSTGRLTVGAGRQ
ncbi:MAG: hypothetical protein E6Q76_16590 [Rhizobium sp.]|nr:MAG: hypothetical protein E6Q76_16590 [Rhizobium sp.]